MVWNVLKNVLPPATKREYELQMQIRDLLKEQDNKSGREALERKRMKIEEEKKN